MYQSSVVKGRGLYSRVQNLKLQFLVLKFSFIFVLASIVFVGFASSASANPKYAALVIDAHTGKILHSRHANKQRHPASLTKIMTLYILFEELQKGQLALDTELIVTAKAASQPPSKIGLKPQQRIKVIDAIRALVTKSANDVAVTVAENLGGTHSEFAKEMTRRAKKMGMTKTVFRNASGLHNPQQVTTAHDMAILAQRIYNDFPKYYKFFKTKHFTYKGRKYRNHNRLLFNYKGTDGIKTGYIRASGFNLVSSVKRKDKHIFAVVMGGKSSKRRNTHMKALLNRNFPKAVAMKRKPRKQFEKSIELASYQNNAQISQQASNETKSQKPIQMASLGATQVPNIQYFGTHPQDAVEANTTANPSQSNGYEAQGSTGQDNIIETTTHKANGPFHVQIGAFSGVKEAKAKLDTVSSNANDLLNGHPAVTVAFTKNEKQYVRARFAAFSKTKARSTCAQLKKRSIDCIVMRAE